MADVIVILSTLLCLAFFAAWWLLPNLRAWIEQPKYHFQEQLRQYDKERTAEADSQRSRP